MAIPSKEEFRKALEQRHGAALQDRFSRASVAVCGLGGLGSGIAIALARAGVGRLHLLDFDKVELSNLNRQQYTVSQLGMYKTEALRDTLLSVAPYCETVIHTERIGEENLEELLRDAEVVCEALDRAEEKAMLVNGVLEQLSAIRYLVSAFGHGGNLAVLQRHPDAQSRQAVLSVRRRDERHCRDRALSGVVPRACFAPRIEANMVLRILAGEHEV